MSTDTLLPPRAGDPADHATADATRLPRPPAPPRRLNTTEEALDAAQALAAVFRTGASERDRTRRLPWDEIEAYTASGLGSITVPRAYGGPELPFTTLAQVFVTLCAADPALGQIPQNHFGVLGILKEAGSEAQKQRLYGEVLAGWRLGNAGPERKSRASPTITQGATTLRDTPAGLRLTGHRYYSTGAIFAHRIPTRAVDEQGRAVHVWVPRTARGVGVVDDWSAFGQRTTASGSVVFEDVPILPEDVLPLWPLADRPGLYGPSSQLIQAAIDQGIAQAALDDALTFVREKARPWVDSGLERAVDDPYLIGDVGRLQIELHAAHEILLEAAQTLDEAAAAPVTAESSGRASVAVAEAKVLTTRIALAASERLFELAGSAATRAAHNLDRHWRNARVHTLHDPVRWKLHLIGNHRLNGVLPARHSWN